MCLPLAPKADTDNDCDSNCDSVCAATATAYAKCNMQHVMLLLSLTLLRCFN